MRCPECEQRSRVTMTRTMPAHDVPAEAHTVARWLGGDTVWRRRWCPSCGARWSTMEVLLDDLAGLHATRSRREKPQP